MTIGTFARESLLDVAEFEDDELRSANLLTHFVVDSMAKLGSVMSDVYGGTGRRFSLVGSSGRFFAGCVRWACRSLEEPQLASNRCIVAGEQR